MKDYASASETLRKALELQPDNAEIKRALAQNLLFADNYDEALKAYSEIVAEDPERLAVATPHFADLPSEERFRESS